MAEPDLPSFHGIIGQSAAMRTLFWQIGRVAPIDVPVLIHGESGTGKELVASAIHRLSRRADRRYEVVNCADLTRDLLRSELFGHERGAFSGAVAKKAGLLAVANGGTVFLDEVGELAPDAQAMLLRFLQSGEGRAVGSTLTTRVDVRIIAATHRDLEAAIAAGAFREDLYYRLRRVVLQVPPLRERRDDIPLLVEHVRRAANARYRLAVTGVSRQAFERLARHPWPGNVRELEAVLEQAMILRGAGWLVAEHVDLPRPRPARAAPPSVPDMRPLDSMRSRHGVSRRQTALQLAAAGQLLTTTDLARACAISHEHARRELVTLNRAGVLRRVGTGRRTSYVLA